MKGSAAAQLASIRVPVPIYLLKRTNWTCSRRHRDTDEEEIDIISAHQSLRAAQLTALSKFESYVKASKPSWAYDVCNDLEARCSFMERFEFFKRGATVEERYTHMIKAMAKISASMQVLEDNFGTTYFVEQVALLPDEEENVEMEPWKKDIDYENRRAFSTKNDNMPGNRAFKGRDRVELTLFV